MRDRLEGLLIDYGGVLTQPLGPVLRRFCRSKGLPDDALAVLQAEDSPFRPELDAYERGEYAEDQFIPRFANALGLPAQDMEAFLHDVEVDDTMFRAVETLRKAGIRTGLLSNSWGVSPYPRERLERAFDGVVISGEVGMRKPEPEIYLSAAAMIGLDPRRCVFVDDTESHLTNAAVAGMTVLHHEHPGRTLQELERLFGVHLQLADGSAAAHG